MPQGLYSYNAFLCFRNVQVPKRATIHKAFLTFTAKNTGFLPTDGNQLDTVTAIIDANDVNDAAPFLTYGGFFNSDRTDNCVAWEEVPHWTEDTTYDSPDIACVVQEIVDRSGWNSGQDMMIYVEDLDSTQSQRIIRRAYDYGDDSSKAPILTIYYTVDETSSGGVVIGGVANSVIIKTETGYGGVVCGGVANSVIVKSETASGGVVVAGTATVAGGRLIHIEVGSGGVVVSGTAEPIFSEIGSGGVVIGGSAENAHISVAVATGGVVVGSPRWRYRRQLVVPAGRVAESLDKFYLPVAVQLDPAKASDSVQFTDDRGLNYPLAFEIRDFDAVSGKLWAYVKTPLEADSENVLYVYYGDEYA